MSSEGGGAVAFPVMTLVLHVSPQVARDFSLMIQSCGMTAAAFTIAWMGVQVEKHSVMFCTVGKFCLFNLIFIARVNLITGDQKEVKMLRKATLLKYS